MCISIVCASTPERPPGSNPAVGSLATPTTSLPPVTGAPVAAVAAVGAVVGALAATVPAGAADGAAAEPAAAVGWPALTGRAVGTSVAVACGAEFVAVGAGVPPPHAARMVATVDA